MRSGRLSATSRVLCLFGPLIALAILVIARFLLPAVWAAPQSAAFMPRACVLKMTTGIPCPFCGGTRAVVHAAHARWRQSLLANPLGVVVVVGGSVVGVWLGLCAATGRGLGLGAVGRFLGRRSTLRALWVLLAALWVWKIVLKFAFDMPR